MRGLLALVALGWCAVTGAAELRFESGPRQVPLLELYTSEGCSSCPRAEAWLRNLKADPDLWKSFVPVAFHVDYWDHLGWKDKFGRRVYSERQRAYGDRWNTGPIYTPEFIAAGKEWRGWLSSKAPPSGVVAEVGNLRAVVDEVGVVSIEYTPVYRSPNHLHARVALLEFGRLSQVNAGENRGSRLVHDFLAISFQEVELKGENGHLRGSLNVAVPAKNSKQHAIAIWVEQMGNPTPIQAAGGWLKIK